MFPIRSYRVKGNNMDSTSPPKYVQGIALSHVDFSSCNKPTPAHPHQNASAKNERIVWI